MNALDHKFSDFTPKLDKTGDAIARALAKFAKSQAQIENDKRLFRFRAKRDARTVMRNIRNEFDLMNKLHLHWTEMNGSEAPTSIEEAISRLNRALRVEKSHTGTSYATGNAFAAIRSRLVMARYFRRFGEQIREAA